MPNFPISGSNYIAGETSALVGQTFFSVNAITQEQMDPAFSVATPAEVDSAVQSATFEGVSRDQKAELLEAIAAEIEGIGDELIERAHAETALPIARLQGERGRTCGQLRMFAQLVKEGSWVDARIDTAIPDRKPVPKPDLRRMLLPIGPVVVFGASNFPLAFSVAGGDTASALAAGCPVIVKAHPAHPGTSELVAKAIVRAIKRLGLPAGIFSMVHGGPTVGQQLVQHPLVRAVGFTGSFTAGKALFDLAAAREVPIPVYSEMGSVNPVYMLPGALASKAEALGTAYADSLTMGVGQFCTNPGIVVGIQSEGFEAFLSAAATRLSGIAPGTALYQGIYERHEAVLAERRQDNRLAPVFDGEPKPQVVQASLFKVSASEFLKSKDLREELFGPAGLAVVCESEAELVVVAKSFDGQLTTTYHSTSEDLPLVKRLLPILTSYAGRVLSGGFPTGVEVCPSMQHGGPFPATTDGRTTSVGMAAIYRFVRPVAFQDLEESLLPDELKSGNPLRIMRLVNSEYSRESVEGV